MKVAFDCSGTLMGCGPDSKVLKLFKWFESKGCEMIIWSNAYSYTVQAMEENGLHAECMSKPYRTYVEPENYMDIAVDDEDQSRILPTKHIILVHDIPDDEALFEETFGELLNDSV